MIVDVYEYFEKYPRGNKLVGDDFMFVEYKCPLDIEDFKFWTKSHLITYVVSGKKDWIAPNQTYELVAGDALFVRKGVYTTKQYLEEDYCVMLFFITDDFIKKFIAENNQFKRVIGAKSNQKLIFEINTDDYFNPLIESIFHYLKLGKKVPPKLVELKFKELLFNIVLNLKNKKLLDFFNTINQNTKSTIEHVMLENFQYNLCMEDFAKLCGRSLSTFKRDFKTIFNTTPSKWQMTKRLEYSKTLLLGTELCINDICYESGFKNPSHFVRAFKEKYDLPPKQFRTQQLKN